MARILTVNCKSHHSIKNLQYSQFGKTQTQRHLIVSLTQTLPPERYYLYLDRLMKILKVKAFIAVKFNMFRSIPYSSIPDRYIPYLPEEFLPVWKIRKKRKAGISPLTDHVPV